jgi:two-component system LytT family sensor kinase
LPIIFELAQQLSVYLLVAYMLSKTPVFDWLFSGTPGLPQQAVIYFFFSSFCILGTYLGLEMLDAIVNTRAIGAVLGGLLGGPFIGVLVGGTGGIHRYLLGGFTDLACALSTTAAGLIGGAMHLYIRQTRQPHMIFNPLVPLSITVVAEFVQMAIILMVAQPFEKAAALVEVIAPPMIICNAIGAALFMMMISDRRNMFERFGNIFSTKALRIAESAVPLSVQDLNRESAEQIARTIHRETGVGGVSITDRDVVLAFVGIGDDHHKPGSLVRSTITEKAIETNQIVFADGLETAYHCPISRHCPIGSAIAIPLSRDDEVFGTIKLYEPEGKLFLNINKSMGEGIARLLASQILAGRLEHQKNLLTQSELKLIQTQVNPHFLFNTLNTIAAVTRQDPEKARHLLQHLSNFFRKNLKRDSDVATLKEELDHVHSYLEIEKARFTDRLSIDVDVDDHLMNVPVPTFTLQPLVENAIKHGVGSLLGRAEIRILAHVTTDHIALIVEDNAGAFTEPKDNSGHGMLLVDRRLKTLYGDASGLNVECEPDVVTRIHIRLPKQLVAA